MQDILISDISDEVLKNLRIKAELRGLLLEDFVRDLIEAEGKAHLAAMRHIRNMSVGTVTSLSSEEYRESLE